MSPTDSSNPTANAFDSDDPDDEDFTDIELTELTDEQSSGASFVTPALPVASAPPVYPVDVNHDSAADSGAVTPAGSAGPDARSLDLDGPAAQAHAVATGLQSFADNLGDLDEAELTDHVEYYQTAHTELQRALSDIDNA